MANGTAGWIKLHRKMMDWELFGDSKAVHVFVALMLMAEHEDCRKAGRKLKAGSMLATAGLVAEATGMSKRTALNKLAQLKDAGCISIEYANGKKSSWRSQKITLSNWAKYQGAAGSGGGWDGGGGGDGEEEEEAVQEAVQEDAPETAQENELHGGCKSEHSSLHESVRKSVRESVQESVMESAYGSAPEIAQSITIYKENKEERKEETIKENSCSSSRCDSRASACAEGTTTTGRISFAPVNVQMPPGARPLPSCPEEVESVARGKGFEMAPGEAEGFIQYNGSRGWTQGGRPVMDWTFLLDGWHRKQLEIDASAVCRRTEQAPGCQPARAQERMTPPPVPMIGEAAMSLDQDKLAKWRETVAKYGIDDSPAFFPEMCYLAASRKLRYDGEDASRGILIHGGTGSGKTTRAKYIAKAFGIELRGAGELLAKCSQYKQGTDDWRAATRTLDPFSPSRSDRDLVIDGIGSELDLSSRFHPEAKVMRAVVMDRYDAWKASEGKCLTHFTTSLTMDQIASVYGEDIASRLAEMSMPVSLACGDRRASSNACGERMSA